VERECTGTVKELAHVKISKDDRHTRGSNTTVPRPMTHACTFIWLSGDDSQYGVTSEDGSEQPPKAVATT